MQRKHVLAYLLFSLFLFFLLVSCFAPSSDDLAKLASEQKYGELATKSEAMLAKRVESEPLYYRSLALQQGGMAEDALFVLDLYFAMAKKDDPHVEGAHRLLCTLSLETDRPQRCIAAAQWLEEFSTLQEADAKAYYQSLLALGESSEATRVFSLYLRDTIESYAYAEMLITSSDDEEKLVQALSSLSHQEQLALLQKVTSVTVTLERATLLLPLATPLEQAFEGTPSLGQVYLLLETLYGYANLRVQGRKYGTLAKNF